MLVASLQLSARICMYVNEWVSERVSVNKRLSICIGAAIAAVAVTAVAATAASVASVAAACISIVNLSISHTKKRDNSKSS